MVMAGTPEAAVGGAKPLSFGHAMWLDAASEQLSVGEVAAGGGAAPGLNFSKKDRGQSGRVTSPAYSAAALPTAARPHRWRAGERARVWRQTMPYQWGIGIASRNDVYERHGCALGPQLVSGEAGPGCALHPPLPGLPPQSNRLPHVVVLGHTRQAQGAATAGVIRLRVDGSVLTLACVAGHRRIH